ncbi:uncharacterized protein JCM10292_000618 [Rhodotorula paludigena]|uniref:uncharacterized protein n=1 Tax=Rhodotorula paludigena TaxID=86838 RepID=UPI00317B9C6B
MSASQHAAPAADLSLKAFMDSVDNLGEAFLHTVAGQGDPPASAKTIKDHFSAWKWPWYLRLVGAPTPRHVTFPGPDPDGGAGWNLLCEADKRTVLSVLQYARQFLAQHHKLPTFQQGSIMRVLACATIPLSAVRGAGCRLTLKFADLRYAKDMAAQKKRRDEADKVGRSYNPRKTIPLPQPMPSVQQWYVEHREKYNNARPDK